MRDRGSDVGRERSWFGRRARITGRSRGSNHSENPRRRKNAEQSPSYTRRGVARTRRGAHGSSSFASQRRVVIITVTRCTRVPLYGFRSGTLCALALPRRRPRVHTRALVSTPPRADASCLYIYARARVDADASISSASSSASASSPCSRTPAGSRDGCATRARRSTNRAPRPPCAPRSATGAGRSSMRSRPNRWGGGAVWGRRGGGGGGGGTVRRYGGAEVRRCGGDGAVGNASATARHRNSVRIAPALGRRREKNK